ncbi:TonB-dependent receptor [Niveispirillum fermenti]|uniref:TonB-dependent receptor n=1 Tax=Niveispirillum fermenti TaxID=1233113 RepID=UPI003A88E451
MLFDKKVRALLLAGAATALVPVAPAQTGDGLLEEIVVTARKRAENLQDTPIAITAVTGAAIEEKGLTSLSEISYSTPNLVLNGSAPLSGNPAAAVVFLRGVGQIDFAIHTDPGVGIYVDGVYVARSVGSVLDLLDLERVEVLRGPQGTLFGRNTIGGAISLTSRGPGDELGGQVAVTMGSDKRREAQFSLDVPVSETVSTKFSGFTRQRDGYVRRLQTGEKMGDDDVLAGRFQLRWQASENLTALVAADVTRRREKSAPNVALDLDPDAFPLAFLYNNRIATNPICQTAPDTSRDCFGAAWQTGTPYATNGTRQTKADVDVFGTSLTLDWEGDGVSVKSITAYREMQAVFGRDTDHTPFDYLYSANDQEQDQFSQEFQVTGRSFDDRLKWLVGAYYFKESAFDDYISAGAVNGSRGLNHVRNSNWALFTEATYDLTPDLHLTAGLRYTDETKKLRTDQYVNTGIRSPIGTIIVADNSWQSRSFTEATPRVTLAYDVSSALMAYGTYSEGFKSGGFNARYSSPVAAPVPYDPEFATLYEAGFKYESPARDLRLNLAAFRTDYDDIQVDFSYPGVLGTLVGNAAAGRIEGVEVEFTWYPLPGLHLDGSVSHLDARYTGVDATVPGIADGNRLPLAPRWSTNLGAAYSFDLPAGALLTPRVDWAYRSSADYDAVNTPIIRQRGYHLLNASIAYETGDGSWRVTLGGRNLTDERYLTSAGYSDAAGVAEGVYARPREWYLSARYSF